MKKLMAIAVLGLAVSQLKAQDLKESDVPQSVKTSFAKSYASAKGVKWEKEEGNFEASFKQNKKETSIVLNDKGDILEVENEIAKSELPKAVSDAVAKDYAGSKIEESAKIVAKGVTTYEVEIEKGEQSWELVYDAHGKLIKKEELKEDKEDKKD